MASLQVIWGAAGAAATVAIFAGWRDHRRRNRDDLDRIGVVDWLTVQAGALIMLGILGYLVVLSR